MKTLIPLQKIIIKIEVNGFDGPSKNLRWRLWLSLKRLLKKSKNNWKKIQAKGIDPPSKNYFKKIRPSIIQVEGFDDTWENLLKALMVLKKIKKKHQILQKNIKIQAKDFHQIDSKTLRWRLFLSLEKLF